MARRFKHFRRRVTAWAAWQMVVAFSWLPRALACRLGECGGALLFRLARPARALALEHLRIAFGAEYSEAERREMARKMFRHFGAVAADVVVMHRMGPAKVRARVRVDGWAEAAAEYDRVLAEGHGLIALTGHFGNWELFGLLGSAQWPGRVKCVGRRSPVPGYQRIESRIRRGLGVQIIYQDESAREALRMLKGNGLLGILPDQDAKHVQGIFIDFFGRPAHTPSAPAKLCASVGSPIVPLFVLREGNRYRVVVRAPIRRDPALSGEAAVIDLTKKWSAVLEEEIRRCPWQWAWVHKRWSTTPEVVERRRRARAEA